MREKFYCLLGALAIALMANCSAWAQTVAAYSVKGVLVDSVSSESEPYATIRVFDMAKPSKQPVKVDVTDENGKFNVGMKAAGKYLATFTVVGKMPAMRTFELDAAHKSVDLGKVRIDLPAGGHWTKTLKIKRPPNPKGHYEATVRLAREGASALVVHQPFNF